MEGYPIWVFSPLLISLAGVWLFMLGHVAAKRQLDSTGAGTSIVDVFFASERKLTALGVRDDVWKSRVGVILETVGVLLFVAFILSAEVA